jgi:Zn finger protein HypA/HybF involved in hydrogenase expression
MVKRNLRKCKGAGCRMSKTKTIEREFVSCNCQKCKQYLAGVPIGSDIYCPNCNQWMTAEKTKQTKLERVGV